MFSSKIFIGILAVLAAYFYTKWDAKRLLSDFKINQNILTAWDKEIKRPTKTFGKISVGINVCLDAIVPGVELLKSLSISAGKAQDHDVIKSLEDLQETFHHFLAKGSAAERYFADGKVFEKMTDATTKLKDVQYYIGGNAALIAQKIAKTFPDTKVELVGPVGERVRSLLHKSISVPEASLAEHDQLHLIMEYKVGEQWGSSIAPVATRFITSHDIPNSRISHLEVFLDRVRQTSPDLIVFSGLHMLEGQSGEVVQDRIRATANGFSSLPTTSVTHLELASMANAQLVHSIMTEVLPHVTALGLNEQELTFTSHVMGGPHGDLFSQPGQPPIHMVTDILTWLLQTYSKASKVTTSLLTRVHFHSLTYHIIGTVPGTWDNLRTAVAAGARNAARQACDTDILLTNTIELRIPETFRLFTGDKTQTLDPNNPVLDFVHEGFQFVFSPVLVCKKPLKTVGLGDSISATGLLFSSQQKQAS